MNEEEGSLVDLSLRYLKPSGQPFDFLKGGKLGGV